MQIAGNEENVPYQSRYGTSKLRDTYVQVYLVKLMPNFVRGALDADCIYVTPKRRKKGEDGKTALRRLLEAEPLKAGDKIL